MSRRCTHQTLAPGEGATSIGRLRFGGRIATQVRHYFAVLFALNTSCKPSQNVQSCCHTDEGLGFGRGSCPCRAHAVVAISYCQLLQI